MENRIIDLYKAIIDATEMTKTDKIDLFVTLHNISNQQIVALEDVYINGNY